MKGVHLSRYLTTPAGRRHLGHRAAQLVPRGRLRLRRQLPAEGRGRAGGAGPGGRVAVAAAGGGGRGERPAARPARRAAAPAARRAGGTPRHRARARLQARHRRRAVLASLPGAPSCCAPPGPRSARTTRSSGPQALDGLGDVTYVEDLAAAVKQAEAVVVVTRWDHYQQVPELVGQLDPPPLVVDGRRMLDRPRCPRTRGSGCEVHEDAGRGRRHRRGRPDRRRPRLLRARLVPGRVRASRASTPTGSRPTSGAAPGRARCGACTTSASPTPR